MAKSLTAHMKTMTPQQLSDMLTSVESASVKPARWVLKKGSVLVSPVKAVEIFNNLMNSKKEFYNPEVEKLRQDKIDINAVLRQIPAFMLSQTFPDNYLNEINTFLNRVVAMTFGGLEEDISQETLHYIALHSEVKKNFTFDVYLRYMPVSPIGRQKLILFSSNTIDYFLDNNNWDLDAQPAFLRSSYSNAGVSSTMMYLQQMASLTANGQMTMKEINSSLMSQAQLDRLIALSSIGTTQSATIFYLSIMAISQIYLSSNQQKAIAQKMSFKTPTEKAELIYNGFRFMKNKNKKALDFLNVCNQTHGINWVKLLIKDKRKSVGITLENIEEFSEHCLRAIILDNDAGVNPRLREMFLQDNRAKEMVAQYDIKDEHKLLSSSLSGVNDISRKASNLSQSNIVKKQSRKTNKI